MQEYISVLKRIFYRQGDPRKWNEKDFMKEISGAYIYGQLEILSLLTNKYINGYAPDEIVGEIQNSLAITYKDYKAIFRLLKIPDFDIDRIIKECNEKRRDNERAVEMGRGV